VTALSVPGAPASPPRPSAHPPRPLEDELWPASAVLDDDGVLRVGGCRVDDLVAEHGSPLLALDEDDFRARCRHWRRAFAGGEVYYAGKAFLSRAVARWVEAEGLSLDVCTGGELGVAQAVGFPPERLLFHGTNTSRQVCGSGSTCG